jgi:hypothetical protein
MDVLTVSSRNHMMKSFEPRFDPLLFPNKKQKRPRKFNSDLKKYVIISARVHPGELPGSHVFNGVLKFLLNLGDKRTE